MNHSELKLGTRGNLLEMPDREITSNSHRCSRTRCFGGAV